MRTPLAVVVAFILFGFVASAAEVTFRACTSDSYAVALTVDLNDQSLAKNPKIPAGVAAAFKATASVLRLDELLTDKGFILFMSKLTEEEQYALPATIDYPALISNTCK